MNTLLTQWSPILANVIALLGSFYGIVMILSALCHIFGWEKGAAFFALVGTDVKGVADKIKAGPGGGTGGAAGVLVLIAFARVLAVLAFATVIAACAAFRAIFPDADALESCEAKVAEQQPAPDLAGFIAQSFVNCAAQGLATVEDVIAFIMKSNDPNVAAYKDEARAAQADPAKMGALRARLGGHR